VATPALAIACYATALAKKNKIIFKEQLSVIFLIIVGPSSDAVLREQSKRGQSCLGIFLLIFSIVLIAITFPVAICLSLKVRLFTSLSPVKERSQVK